MYDKLDGICPEVDEGYSTQPVKVAILDTGAYMSRDNYKHAYSGRLKECRTWLNTAEADGEVFALGSSDDDGHGTHGASVLLQATRSTDVHVYVAQVFSGRNEKVVENVKNMPTVDRIVNVSRQTLDICTPADSE
jgi:subtilisin family serine protease